LFNIHVITHVLLQELLVEVRANLPAVMKVRPNRLWRL